MRKLSRNTNSRKALTRSLIRSLVKEGSIETTKAKAKLIQPQLDRLMVKVSKGDVATRRQILAELGNDRETSEKLFTKWQDLAKSRKSGFTTISTVKFRKGDNSEIVKISFVQ